MSGPTITRYRGDTISDEFTVQSPGGGTVNIAGFTFRMTIDKLQNPPDATTKLLEIVGTITDAANGVVEFAWDAVGADQPPGGYYYDIEMTDASSKVQTLTVGRYTFVQDISK